MLKKILEYNYGFYGVRWCYFFGGIENEKFININYFDYFIKEKQFFWREKYYRKWINLINDRDKIIILIESESVI